MTATPERTEPMRLDAYYYGFDSTGEEMVDRVLSAVACAGKSFHNTSEWGEPSEYLVSEPFLRGTSCVEHIQNAAQDAAAEIAALRQRALDEKARADAAEAVLVTYKAAVSRHLQLSMEAILDSTEPVNVALKRADAAEAREAGLRRRADLLHGLHDAATYLCGAWPEGGCVVEPPCLSCVWCIFAMTVEGIRVELIETDGHGRAALKETP